MHTLMVFSKACNFNYFQSILAPYFKDQKGADGREEELHVNKFIKSPGLQT